MESAKTLALITPPPHTPKPRGRREEEIGRNRVEYRLNVKGRGKGGRDRKGRKAWDEGIGRKGRKAWDEGIGRKGRKAWEEGAGRREGTESSIDS